MANPYFVAGVLEPITFTMSGTENSSFPLSNLKTYDPRDIWKGAGGIGDESLKIDLGANDPVDTMVIHEHNFEALPQDANVKLQYDNNNNGAYSAVTTVYTIDGTGLSEPTAMTFAKVTGKRYWRLLFTKVAQSFTPELGNLYTRQRFDFGPKGLPFQGPNEEYQTAIALPALDGTLRRAQSFLGRRAWEFDFSLVTDTVAESIRQFILRVRAAGQPFYFVNESGAAFFVILDDDKVPIEQSAYNVNRTNRIRFREVLTGKYTGLW